MIDVNSFIVDFCKVFRAASIAVQIFGLIACMYFLWNPDCLVKGLILYVLGTALAMIFDYFEEVNEYEYEDEDDIF